MKQLCKDRRIFRLDETASTNLYMRQILKDQHLEEGSLVIADYQTAGRGQMGNTWFSSKGKNLLFSVVIYPQKVRANAQFIFSRIASLAIQKTLSNYTNDIRIKWPNDIYWRDFKIAGMLIENDVQGMYVTNVIIGIGININEPVYPSQLPNPVSLRQITGAVQDREQILKTFQSEFFLLYAEFQKGNTKVIEDEYMHNLYRSDGYYCYDDGNDLFKAKIEKVYPSGLLELKLEGNDELRTYSFKEVEFVQ